MYKLNQRPTYKPYSIRTPFLNSISLQHSLHHKKLFFAMKVAGIITLTALAACGSAAPAADKRSLSFQLSSEADGQGERKSFFVSRWQCRSSSSY